MKGYVYKITNKINNKSYIGQTVTSLEERYKSHLKDFAKRDSENRPLYSAMKKYGIQNFKIECLEEVDFSLLANREQYWIYFYNTYENGYNATRGGEGKCLYNHELILDYIKQGKTTKEIIELVNCCKDVIHDIAKRNEIKIRSSQFKRIAQYSLQGEYIQTFNTITEAAQWLIDNQYSKATTTSGMKNHIGDVAKGKRKTAYKHLWKYTD